MMKFQVYDHANAAVRVRDAQAAGQPMIVVSVGHKLGVDIAPDGSISHIDFSDLYRGQKHPRDYTKDEQMEWGGFVPLGIPALMGHPQNNPFNRIHATVLEAVRGKYEGQAPEIILHCRDGLHRSVTAAVVMQRLMERAAGPDMVVFHDVADFTQPDAMAALRPMFDGNGIGVSRMRAEILNSIYRADAYAKDLIKQLDAAEAPLDLSAVRLRAVKPRRGLWSRTPA